MALVNLERKLTDDEVEFVFQNFHPGAEHNVGKDGAFFTPLDLACDAALFAYPTGDPGGLRYLDACAGIGALSYALRAMDSLERKITEIVAIEANPRFVEVGKRLLPQVTWINGSIFDVALLQGLGWFDIAISNPPYGNLKSTQGQMKWLTVQQPAHLAVAEVLSRLCKRGAVMIIPATDHNMEDNRAASPSMNYQNFRRSLPAMDLVPVSVDCSIYKFKAATPKVAVVDLSTDPGDSPYFGNLGAIQLPKLPKVEPQLEMELQAA